MDDDYAYEFDCDAPFVAIDYVLAGERDPAAVASGATSFGGVVIARESVAPVFFPAEVAWLAVVNQGYRRRVYCDALLARVVEHRFCIQQAETYRDIRIQTQLLGEQPPFSAAPSTPCRSRPEDQCVEALGRVGQFVDVARSLVPRLFADKLQFLDSAVEIPLTKILAAMIFQGLGVDQRSLDRIEQQFSERLSRHTRKRPVGDARESALRECRAVVAACEVLRRHISPRTGRVHPWLDPLSTLTGRIACCPNLGELPRAVLPAICARDGHSFVELRLRQLELAIVAGLSQEPKWLAGLRGNADLHRQAAALALVIPEAAVTSEQRDRVGKRLNFGILGDGNSQQIANATGLLEYEVKALMRAYVARYPRIFRWREGIQRLVCEQGYVTTWSHRRLRFPEFRSRDLAAGGQASQQLLRTVIEGNTADSFKQIILGLHRQLPSSWAMVLTVPNSVLLEIPADEIPQAIPWLRTIAAEPASTLPVPLRVTVKAGRTWADCRNPRGTAESLDTNHPLSEP